MSGYEIGYGQPSAADIINDAYNPKLEDNSRFTIETNANSATLRIPPGGTPFPYDDKFRLYCVGSNGYTADAAHVEFAPNWQDQVGNFTIY